MYANDLVMCTTCHHLYSSEDVRGCLYCFYGLHHDDTEHLTCTIEPITYADWLDQNCIPLDL